MDAGFKVQQHQSFGKRRCITSSGKAVNYQKQKDQDDKASGRAVCGERSLNPFVGSFLRRVDAGFVAAGHFAVV